MKSRKVETITSNDELVRLDIYEGRIPLDAAGGELLRLTRDQYAAESRRHDDTIADFAARIRKLEQPIWRRWF